MEEKRLIEIQNREDEEDEQRVYEMRSKKNAERYDAALDSLRKAYPNYVFDEIIAKTV